MESLSLNDVAEETVTPISGSPAAPQVTNTAASTPSNDESSREEGSTAVSHDKSSGTRPEPPSSVDDVAGGAAGEPSSASDKEPPRSATPQHLYVIGADPAPYWHLHIEDVGIYNHYLHPVHLGDRLGPNQRYKVMHKLGNGSEATVWLCRDMGVTNTTKYVAVKVVRPYPQGVVSFETKLKSLDKTLVSEAGICVPIDEFQGDGPNGPHTCFVYELLGPKVSRGLHDGGDDPDKSLRRICYSLVKTVSVLHENGICHNHLSAANVLHQTPGFDGLTEDELSTLIGKPAKKPVRVSGKDGDGHDRDDTPQYLVYSMDWYKIPIRYIHEEPRLIDYGQSFHVSEPRRNWSRTSSSYLAPELILEGRRGLASDLWALACVLFEIRTGLRLFYGFDDSPYEVLYTMSRLLGKLPEPWWSTTWKRRREELEDGGSVDQRMSPDASDGEDAASSDSEDDSLVDARACRDYANSIEYRLRVGLLYEWHGRGRGAGFRGESRPIPKEEIVVFADLLKKLLRYDPDARISAAEALEHEWFKM